jgi:hypothetical protein
MLARSLLAGLIILVGTGPARAQTPATNPGTAWRSTPSPGSTDPAQPAVAAGPEAPAGSIAPPRQIPAAADPSSASPITKVSKGSGTLPNDQGQVWREYDISPYTLRVTSTNRPEQAIVDWILRDTGYEAWHSDPLGILSATKRSLRVYHTPQMQAVVANIVDRFVSTEAETRAFGLRVITVDHPNWRAKARQVLRPVPVQTPGVQAWLLQREDAALVLADMRRRTDFREHVSPHLLVNNGQSTVIPALRARTYVRDVALRSDNVQGYEAETGQIDEGFSLEFNPLLSVDGQMIDAAIKCNIDQVERMVAVVMDVPTANAPRQRTQVEVPQITHFRFHERFRWPESQVLVIGMGMVPIPVPVEGKTLVPGVPLRLPTSPPRGELIVMVESRGKLAATAGTARTGQRETTAYEGRY